MAWVRLHRGTSPIYVNLDTVRYIETVAGTSRQGSKLVFRDITHISGGDKSEYLHVNETPAQIMELGGITNA